MRLLVVVLEDVVVEQERAAAVVGVVERGVALLAEETRVLWAQLVVVGQIPVVVVDGCCWSIVDDGCC